LLYALGRDCTGMPGKMIRSSGSIWEERSEESLWRTLRSGEILEIVAEAVRNGYGLPLVEALVEEMWHDAFDGRIDVAQLVTDRFERLASELEARRNLLAVEIEESFLELIGLRGFHPVVVDEWLIEQLEAGITQKAGKLGAQSVGIELLAFGGGELAAYQTLQISRKLANKAAGQLGRRMAGSVLARTGGTVASALGSSWMTFGLSLAVAVVVDIGFNEISEYRMKKELRENMQEFREMFWEGTDEMPGIYPQMIAAFFDYQSRMVGVFEKSSSEWNGFAGPQLVSENQFRQQELEFVKEKGGL
ncbi:MAG TPA: hypothetical protein VK041_02990, partial [Opitutales bacterium]|nr:hypothetical protein [Opitutales bacterium]